MLNHNDMRQYLIDHDIKPSYQRIAIYNFLAKPHLHMTVDQIYKELSPNIPTLSKTTVYNTLKLMVEKGIALEITTDDHESQYEICCHTHGHFKCLNCKTLYDFPFNNESLETSELKDFDIESRQIVFYGTCATCKQNKS